MQNKFNRSSLKMGVQLLLIVTAAFLVWGCGGSGGGSSYDTAPETNNAPVTGAATNVLIEPATLKAFMDEGLVGKTTDFGANVVILDFGPYVDTETDSMYINGPRIPGACRVKKADLDAVRFEGVGLASPMAPTGAQIDAVIQRLAINENTTIVFTTGSSSYYSTRAYWIFRYWGFPKERLRLLDGGNSAFSTAYPSLMTTAVPTPTASDYSVKDLDGLNNDLRASVGEMIGIIKTLDLPGSTDVVLDARGDGATSGYNGTSATSAQLVSGAVTVFDGHPAGGEALSQGTLFTSGLYKPASDDDTDPTNDLTSLFAAKGWSADKKTTVYCTTGYSATPLFFVLDAMLGADVQLFDGSWSQLGKYSDYAYGGGELPANSDWAIDKYIESLTYNKGEYSRSLLIESLSGLLDSPPAPFTSDVPGDDSDVNSLANQVEVADLAAVGTTPTVTITAPTNPLLTASSSVLIEPATLEGWMDAGLVNAAAGSDRVVILDVTSSDSYTAGHIPGAQLWNTSGQAETRLEGPSNAVNMVITPDHMNERLKALAIDEYTTIVITSSQTASYFPSRAYFTFRYYGWPKSRLKVLNGYNFVWDQTDLSETATDLEDLTSPLTVQAVANLQPDLRVSLPELMDAIRDGRGVPVDMRGSSVVAAGSTTGVFNEDHNGDGSATQTGGDADYVVFEGTMKGGEYYSYAAFQMDPTSGDYRYRPADIIKNAFFAATGLDGTEVVYSMCRTAYIASTGFFVLDALLDWPVMVYDGSWSQWGSMSDDADMGGQLTSGSPWAVDNATYMEVINYNKTANKEVEPLDADEDALELSPAEANQIEDTDYDYQIETTTSGSSTAPTSSSGIDGGNC